MKEESKDSIATYGDKERVIGFLFIPLRNFTLSGITAYSDNVPSLRAGKTLTILLRNKRSWLQKKVGAKSCLRGVTGQNCGYAFPDDFPA